MGNPQRGATVTGAGCEQPVAVHGAGEGARVLLNSHGKGRVTSACRRPTKRVRILSRPHAETSRCKYMRCCSSPCTFFFCEQPVTASLTAHRLDAKGTDATRCCTSCNRV